MLTKLQQSLDERKARHLYRTRQVLDSPQGARVRIGDREYLNFCSNDYLGLADHPRLKAAFKSAVDRYGVGSGAAHLVTGHMRPHHQLEEELAEFVGRPRALLFSTGYMANLGVISALLGRQDTVFEDRLNHASLIDAAVLSRAGLKRYRHGDLAQLENQLQHAPATQRLIASDAVFSMDGDLAPAPQLARLAQHYQAWLLLDDAHGLGVLGQRGAGTLEHFNLDVNQVPILMGTLGKALGSFGAFVAGEEALIETLIQQARSYVFTTALPPAIAEATRMSLRLVQEESWRREHLQDLIRRFRQGAAQLGLRLMDAQGLDTQVADAQISIQTPIQPWLIGDAERSLRLSEQLRQRGILISAIRPPTVPQGTARLRITLSAAHQAADVDELLHALAAVQ